MPRQIFGKSKDKPKNTVVCSKGSVRISSLISKFLAHPESKAAAAALHQPHRGPLQKKALSERRCGLIRVGHPLSLMGARVPLEAAQWGMDASQMQLRRRRRSLGRKTAALADRD